MLRLKSEKDIAVLAEGGRLLAKILDAVVKKVAPGVTGQELDELARQLIADAGVKPSFLNFTTRRGEPGFPAALCVSVNDAVVHGLPTATPLQVGDIVGVDLGIIYEKLYLDHARTVGVGAVSTSSTQLMAVTREALARGIKAAQVGSTIGDIGATIQRYVEEKGFSVVRQLVGHGVGYAVHEEPPVPNYGQPGRGAKLQAGLVIAIEPMVTRGDATVETADDDWTVKTQTGELSAHEEHTVAITPEGPKILTTLV